MRNRDVDQLLTINWLWEEVRRGMLLSNKQECWSTYKIVDRKMHRGSQVKKENKVVE